MEDFIGRLKRTINKGISTVSERSSYMLETARIRGQIARLEDQRNELLQILGSNVYLTYKDGDLDEQFIAEKCDEISAVELDIMRKTDELQALMAQYQAEPIVECACGAKLQPGVNFCPNCGRRVAVEPEADAEKCVCGADIQPGSKFCPNCGRQFEE
ncbi:MAG TPA: zinc ribbon domain-containing protein [Firmicutes bacterium]|jgi:hypothetical protein|nr:zinc ribbon domain-containing protein [Bacillota bacterium]